MKMKNMQWGKGVATLFVICAVCFISIFNADAAPKIKSKSVSLNITKVTMAEGDIVTLDAVMKPVNSTDTITWSSSKKSVATVNKYGVVTAKEEGTATITVKTSSKKKAKCTVTVKKYLTEKEILDLISKQCLSEESLKKMIANYSLSKSQILELIKQNSVTEDAIKALVQNSTLTEEDVKRIISESSVGDGNSGNRTEWQDGTELSMISGQNLPVKAQNGVTVTKVTIKKYHYAYNSDGELPELSKGKYKYVAEIEGILDNSNNTGEIEIAGEDDFNIQFLRSDGADASGGWIFGENGVKYTKNDEKIVYTADFYESCDYDEYMIAK